MPYKSSGLKIYGFSGTGVLTASGAVTTSSKFLISFKPELLTYYSFPKVPLTSILTADVLCSSVPSAAPELFLVKSGAIPMVSADPWISIPSGC